MEDQEEDLNPKQRGLGRGLDALFEDEEGVYPQPDPEGHTPGAQRKLINIGHIEPNPDQPRQNFEQSALKDLANSIKKHGILQPILVRPNKTVTDHYEIVAGERRWRAAQVAQLHEVPVIIRDLDDTETFQIALIENLQREDLNAVEEAQGYQRLIDDFDHSAESIGDAVGKSRSHVANMVRLLQLPQSVQTMVANGDLSAGHARALIKAENPALLAQEVVQRGFSVRQTEKLAAQSSGRDIQSRPRASKSKPEKDVDLLALEQEISNKLGMNVVINTKGNHTGQVLIEYKTLDQLDDLLRRLSQNADPLQS